MDGRCSALCTAIADLDTCNIAQICRTDAWGRTSFTGETSAQEAARKHGLTVADVEKWLELALAGMENQLRSRPHDDEALRDERIKQLERKIGKMALDIDIMEEAVRPYRPTVGRTSDE